jgi:endonuclease/exonuclease/phosphatase family metal-dependent hydrolase
MRSLFAAVAVVLLLALAPAAGARELAVVQTNVGNVNVPGCNEQVFKLCLRPVEERASDALKALRPDLVGFEEILPPDLCARAPSANPYNLCSRPLSPPSQVERLLGAGHAHDCDQRFGWDCLAVKRRRLRLTPLATRPVQPACEDNGFTLNTATVRLRGWPITAAVAHPSSTDAVCRAQQLRDFFLSLPAAGPALLLGDFNLDPFREEDESVREWDRWVPSHFRLVSGEELTSLPCGSSQLDPTGLGLDTPVQPCTGPLSARTIDHVLVRGLKGDCHVERVDGGGGMDHRAQVCRIEVGPSAAPALRVRRRGCEVRFRLKPRPAHLRAVRFRLGKRTKVDRRRPYRLRRRGRERLHGGPLVVRPLLVNGRGPVERRALPPCAV